MELPENRLLMAYPMLKWMRTGGDTMAQETSIYSRLPPCQWGIWDPPVDHRVPTPKMPRKCSSSMRFSPAGAVGEWRQRLAWVDFVELLNIQCGGRQFCLLVYKPHELYHTP